MRDRGEGQETESAGERVEGEADALRVRDGEGTSRRVDILLERLGRSGEVGLFNRETEASATSRPWGWPVVTNASACQEPRSGLAGAVTNGRPILRRDAQS